MKVSKILKYLGKAFKPESKQLRKLLNKVSKPMIKTPYIDGSFLIIEATKKGEPICPACGGKNTLYTGPSGGMSVNVLCRNVINKKTGAECGAKWNTIFGNHFEPINSRAQEAFNRIERKSNKKGLA